MPPFAQPTSLSLSPWRPFTEAQQLPQGCQSPSGAEGAGDGGRQPAEGSRTPCLAPAPPRGRPPVPPGPGAAGSPRASRRGPHRGLRAGAARCGSRVVLPKPDKRHKFSAFFLFSAASGSWMLSSTFILCARSWHGPVLCKSQDSPCQACLMLDNIL